MCTVILSQILHNRHKKDEEKVDEVKTVDTDSLEDDDDIYVSHGHHVLHAHEVMKMEAEIEAVEPLKTWSFRGVVHDFKEHLKPWPSMDEWDEMNIFQKVIAVLNVSD